MIEKYYKKNSNFLNLKISNYISFKNRMSDAQIVNIKTTTSKTIISPEEKELSIFLYTIFQFYLEKAIDLMNQDDPLKKEKALKILNSLLENPFINHFKTNKTIFACIHGILNFYIGLVKFNEEQQINCEAPFIKALDFFNTLPTAVKIRYINIYQEIYNNLGIVFYNKGEIKKGLQYLGKAEQIYKVFNDLTGYNSTNSFQRFMLSCSRNEVANNNYNMSFTTNSTKDDKLEFFNFYIDGGLNKKGIEHNYTLTIFYYAQAFTKLGFRKKAIKYCSLTLKRQIEFNEYDLKDAIVNCINLSDFYMENQHYAQAEYILISAISLLPEDQKKKKKLRATVHMQLGKYFLERLKFAVKQTKEQLWISDNEELSLIVNRRIFTFNSLNIVWPKIEDIRDIEHAKLLFRLSNTQFKKSLEYYVLEGFVSEHINVSRDMSQLYKYLVFFETDNNRIYAMFHRRIALLEPIINKLNPKAFIIQWQELGLELGEIYSEMFESKYELLRMKQNVPSQNQFDEINLSGDKAVNYYKSILKFAESEYEKPNAETTVEDFITIITIKLNLARLLSKYDFKDLKKKVNYLTTSLKMYEETYSNLKKSQYTKTDSRLSEHLVICDEMINLLPVKISKINRRDEI